MAVKETDLQYLFHIEDVSPQNLAMGLLAYLNEVDPKRGASAQRNLQELIDQSIEVNPRDITGRIPSVCKEALLKYGIHSDGAWLSGESRELSEVTRVAAQLWDELSTRHKS